MSGTSWLTFVPVAPGLESALSSEVESLLPGVKLKVRAGGVELRVDLAGLVTLVRRSRVAESVRVRIARFEARDFRTLEAELGKIPWDAYVRRGAESKIRVRARRSKLIHSDAIAERVTRALDRRGPGPGGLGPTVHVRLEKDRVQVSVEAADEFMHRRGWRAEFGAAPLRENLAAACLRLSGWDPNAPLWDPFCGSGTVLLEALEHRSPGCLKEEQDRQIQRWPIHDEEAWSRLDRGPVRAREGGQLLGTDRDPRSIDRARGNAKRASAAEHAQFEVGGLLQTMDRVPLGATVVTNTPYGKRLSGGKDLRQTFRDLGRVLRERPDLGPVVALVGHPRFEHQTGLTWSALSEFPNRGTRVRLVRLER